MFEHSVYVQGGGRPELPLLAPMMTIQTVYEILSECLDKIMKAGADDDSSFGLELLVTQLRIRIHSGVYDPLKRINANASEVYRFVNAVAEFDRLPAETELRTCVIEEIASLVKTFLRQEGVPFRA